MDRIEFLRKYIDELLLNMKDVDERRCAYLHLYGVAQACALIALKRGENAELATMAGMLHDIYTYLKMDRTNHEHNSALLARDILKSLRIANEEETRIICDAIDTHSQKALIHVPFNEVLKDADVLQHYLYNPMLEIRAQEKARYEKLKEEFGLS